MFAEGPTYVINWYRYLILEPKTSNISIGFKIDPSLEQEVVNFFGWQFHEE